MIKRPDISLSRSGTNIVVTLRNFEEGDTWNVYTAPDKIGTLTQQVSGHDQASYTIENVPVDANRLVVVAFNDGLNRALEIVEDLSEDEGYVIVESRAPAEITTEMTNISMPWRETDPEIEVSVLENASIEGNQSRPAISIGENQTL